MNMYSPRIDSDLVPCLYWVARERSLPMTRLVNRYVCRGLTLEALSTRALSYLPQRVMDLRMGDDSLDHVVQGEPYTTVAELDHWHDTAVWGITRAFGTVQKNQRAKSTADVLWRYAAAQFAVREIYTHAMQHVILPPSDSSRLELVSETTADALLK